MGETRQCRLHAAESLLRTCSNSGTMSSHTTAIASKVNDNHNLPDMRSGNVYRCGPRPGCTDIHPPVTRRGRPKVRMVRRPGAGWRNEMTYIVSQQPKPKCQECGRSAFIRVLVHGRPSLCADCLPLGTTDWAQKTMTNQHDRGGAVILGECECGLDLEAYPNHDCAVGTA